MCRGISNIGFRLIGAAALATSVSADWPNFRGPNHDGISQETGLRLEWKEPIPKVWERNVGSAFSSFACVGDRVYTCGTKNKKQVLYALHADTGEIVWENAFEQDYKEPQGGDGTRATPSVSDGRVYILGARGRLLCVEAATGKDIWDKQFDHRPQWGYSGSVLIEGDLAIATAGKGQGAIAAFDKATGRERWKAGNDPPGYATPYPFTFGARRYIVGFTGKNILIVEAESGREVWKAPWETSYDVNAASPIFHDGHLFVASGYSTGSAVYKLGLDGEKLTGTEVWKNTAFLAKFQSCVLHKGTLYGSDQRALISADFMTGQEHWRKRHLQNGTLVLIGDYLLFLSEKGELQIAPASPTEWNPITTVEILNDRCWSVPVVHRGRLYARNLDRIVCLDLREARPGNTGPGS